jgi:hypothetical protein
VNNYAGGNVLVAGSADAPVGSWRCGTILGRDETVVYAQGSVSGPTRSNACAGPGDSGGSWISGNQAQGPADQNAKARPAPGFTNRKHRIFVRCDSAHANAGFGIIGAAANLSRV